MMDAQLSSRILQASRAQTIPFMLSLLVLTVMLSIGLQMIGLILGAQIRAQNAADSAATAIVGLQAQQWNQMSLMLYANDIEEYRIRHLLESMRLAAQNEGGCAKTGTKCTQVYTNLRTAYLKSLTRYDNNSQILSRITSSTDFRNLWSDGNTLLQVLSKNCSSNVSSALPCAYTYAMPSFAFTVRNKVENADAYAQILTLPGAFGNTGQSDAYQPAYGPLAVEVAACQKISLLGTNPLFKNIFPTTIIARGAATDVMISQEWIEPGTDRDSTNAVYQPLEKYGSANVDGTNWYEVNYGGNSYRTQTSSFSSIPIFTIPQIVSEEMSTRLAWWAAAPIHAFSGSHAVTDFFPSGCPS